MSSVPVYKIILISVLCFENFVSDLFICAQICCYLMLSVEGGGMLLWLEFHISCLHAAEHIDVASSHAFRLAFLF